jgi:hypothetical protein
MIDMQIKKLEASIEQFIDLEECLQYSLTNSNSKGNNSISINKTIKNNAA